jgi:large subunit ribosomal protein L22
MEVTVKLNHLRVTARKAREVVDLIRGKTATEAKVLLSFAARRSAEPILKLLNSAVASAKHDFQIEEENLFVSKTMVNEGPTLKRSFPMSRGRAYPIMKRSSHIIIVLSEINPKGENKEPAKVKEKNKKDEVKKEKKEIKIKKKTVRRTITKKTK